MNKIKSFFVLLFFLCSLSVSGKDKRVKAVYDLIERVTPGYSSQYRLELIAPDNGSDYQTRKHAPDKYTSNTS